MALKLARVSESLQKCLPKFTLKRNPTAILLILIPEYGQANATLVLCMTVQYVRLQFSFFSGISKPWTTLLIDVFPLLSVYCE